MSLGTVQPPFGGWQTGTRGTLPPQLQQGLNPGMQSVLQNRLGQFRLPGMPQPSMDSVAGFGGLGGAMGGFSQQGGMGGFDPRAIAANPQGFQQWQQQARQQEQMRPGSTMLAGGGMYGQALGGEGAMGGALGSQAAQPYGGGRNPNFGNPNYQPGPQPYMGGGQGWRDQLNQMKQAQGNQPGQWTNTGGQMQFQPMDYSKMEAYFQGR
jgi:hypothetical protein